LSGLGIIEVARGSQRLEHHVAMIVGIAASARNLFYRDHVPIDRDIMTKH